MALAAFDGFEMERENGFADGNFIFYLHFPIFLDAM